MKFFMTVSKEENGFREKFYMHSFPLVAAKIVQIVQTIP
jgi:hypothetical protein